MLGLLVNYPQTLRLSNIADHTASVGFPDHHPPMSSFLGVPVRIGDRIFGNLYLAEKQGASEFTADDEELVSSLAAVAGTAIENAKLFDELQRRQAWQTAMIDIATSLIADGDTEAALRSLLHHVALAVNAAGATVAVPTSDPQKLRVVMAEGIHERWRGAEVPASQTIVGAAIASRQAVIVDSPAVDERTGWAASVNPLGEVGQTMAVPMTGPDDVYGVLTVSRRIGEPMFDQFDRELVSAAAAQAGIALALAQARRDSERTRIMEDRGQIAEDLQGEIIGRLFAHGFALQSIASRAGQPSTASAVEAQIDEVDAIIHDIRAAVFRMRRD